MGPWVVVVLAPLALAGVPVPQDCSSQPFREGASDARLALECTLSAINSQAERTNFGVIPSELTAGLTVRCSDGQSLSELDPEGFRSLVWLEELSLRDCRLERLPDRAFLGLTRLNTLRVTTPAFLSLSYPSLLGLTSISSSSSSASFSSFNRPALFFLWPDFCFPDSNSCQRGPVHLKRGI